MSTSRRPRALAALFTAVLACCTLFTAPPSAHAQLVAALSNHLVAIRTTFAGTEVLLFGATDGLPGDVVVVVRGPESAVTVHRKGRSFGIWVNEADLVFDNVPGFWSIAATRSIDDLLAPGTAEFHQMGLAYLPFTPREEAAQRRLVEFREALIRNKQRTGLYTDAAGAITFLGDRLFRTDLWIPGNAPIGTYTISVYLVRDQEVVGAQTIPLVVGKVGFEAYVYDFAHRQSAAYGLVAVAVAAVAGWLASLFFRKG